MQDLHCRFPLYSRKYPTMNEANITHCATIFATVHLTADETALPTDWNSSSAQLRLGVSPQKIGVVSSCIPIPVLLRWSFTLLLTAMITLKSMSSHRPLKANQWTSRKFAVELRKLGTKRSQEWVTTGQITATATASGTFWVDGRLSYSCQRGEEGRFKWHIWDTYCAVWWAPPNSMELTNHGY